MRSSSLPLAPTNGRPSRSSSAPGPSPTTIRAASGLPSANTVLVAVALRAQPSNPLIAASSAARVWHDAASARLSAAPAIVTGVAPDAAPAPDAVIGAATAGRAVGNGVGLGVG